METTNESLIEAYKAAIDELIIANETMFGMGIMTGLAIGAAMILIYLIISQKPEKRKHQNL